MGAVSVTWPEPVAPPCGQAPFPRAKEGGGADWNQHLLRGSQPWLHSFLNDVQAPFPTPSLIRSALSEAQRLVISESSPGDPNV